MTAPVHAPVAAGLNTEGRLQLLGDLTHQTHVLSYDEVMARLREYKHPLVPWLQAVDGFAAHQQTIAKVNALRTGAKDPGQFTELPDLSGWYLNDRRQSAIEYFEDEARGVLYDLASGET